MSTTIGPPGGGPAQKSAHDVIAIAAFELIGVGLLTVLADTSDTMANLVLIFMGAILLFWFIYKGAGFLGHFVGPKGVISNLTNG